MMPRRESRSTSAAVSHPTLRVPDGPWCQPTWQVVDVAGDRRRQAVDPCAVDDCDGLRYWLGGPRSNSAATSGLCYAHYFQWFRAGQPPDFTAWAQTGSTPIGPPRGRPTTQMVDFRRLPPTAADEVRFVVATKVARGDWTCNASLRRVLMVLIDTAEGRVTDSLTERTVHDWLLLCRQHWPYASAFDSLCAPYIRSFFRLLDGATNPDPWTGDHWHWRDQFDFVLDATQSGSTHTAVDWSLVPVPWLRIAVKNLARQQLTTATLSWGTLTQWVRATRQLAQFLTHDGTVPAPPAVTRSVFLDYLAWTRRADTTADARLANTGAYLLESLHDTGLVCDLGSSMFLRRGEKRPPQDPQPPPVPAGRHRAHRHPDRRQPRHRPNAASDDRHHPMGRMPHLRTGRPAARLPAPLRGRALDRILDDQNQRLAPVSHPRHLGHRDPGAADPCSRHLRTRRHPPVPRSAIERHRRPDPALVHQRPATPPLRPVPRTPNHLINHHRRADLRATSTASATPSG